MKDVGEYFDHIEDFLANLGLVPQPVQNSEVFAYEEAARGRRTGRGHLLARIQLGPETYLAIDDWIAPVGNHLERQTHSYDLVHRGRRVESWHRHHGGNHRHDDATHTKIPIARITLQQVVEWSLRAVWEDALD